MKNLVILAGGKSSRMGRDKALLEIEGETFLEHLACRAGAVFDRVLISADSGEHAERIQSLPLFCKNKPEIVLDGYSAIGPMGGLCSVFEQTGLERFAVIPVDVPRADMRALAALHDRTEGIATVLCKEDGFPEPLIGVYDRRCMAYMKKAIAGGDYRLRKILEQAGCRTVPMRELADALHIPAEALCRSFQNINDQEDYARYVTGGI